MKIVLIHKGNSWYLPYSLSQLKHTNPNAEIILLGDNKNKHYNTLVSHKKISDYSKSAINFAKVYKHYSTLGYKFELFCIQRWFILRDYMATNTIEKLIYLDSDILVYSDLFEVQKTFGRYESTFVAYSAHTNYINSFRILDEFCNFVYNYYTQPNAEQLLKDEYEEWLKHSNGGGISDMTFIYKYYKSNQNTVIDISKVQNNSTFDITLDNSSDYEMINNFKKIQIINSKPYGYHLKDNKKVLFHTLHFQGAEAKKYISKYTTFKKPHFLFFRYLFILVLQKIVQKLFIG